MTISFNAGATGDATTAASMNLILPPSLLLNDAMTMFLACFTEHPTAPVISFSGAGGAWTLTPTTDASANPQVSQNGTIFAYGYLLNRVATAGDLSGPTLAITETGSPAGTTWLTAAMTAHTGVNPAAPIDVAGGASGGLTDVVTCPAEVTTIANDWALYLGGGGANGSGATMPGPTGATSRESLSSSAGVAAAVFDSNGSVGGIGTSIGGTSAYQFFTSNHPSTGFLTGFTVALAPFVPPPAVAVPAAGGGRSMLKRSLVWADL